MDRAEERKRLRTAALELYNQGFSIIPLTHPWDGEGFGKTAACLWKIYCARRPTQAEVDGWWPEKDEDGKPLHNIGVICGPVSRLLVLNLNSKAELDLAFRSDLPLPTVSTVTDNGQHWYYKWDDRFAIRTGMRLGGMELVGEGGYVVGVGSRRQSGELVTLGGGSSFPVEVGLPESDLRKLAADIPPITTKDSSPPVLPTSVKSVLANVDYIDGIELGPGGRIKSIAVSKPAAKIRKQVLEQLNGWPCAAGTGTGVLFAVKEGWDKADPASIWWLTNPAALFAWFHDVFSDVCWCEGLGLADINDQTPRSFINKTEFFTLLTNYPGARYDEVCNLPHYPPLPNVLYLTPDLPEPDPNLPVWNEWLAMLNPESEEDRLLLGAATLTPLWGGLPGTRPSFLITSKHGRGVGKTSTAEAIAEIYGGAVVHKGSGHGNEDITKSLISPEGMSKRIVIWDNLKGKTDCAQVESLITSRSVQGHRLYVGHTGRINHLTWFLTANRPETGSDITQRVVPIEIGPPQHSVSFVSKVAGFLKANRLKLLSEMLYILGPQYPKQWELEPGDKDRWNEWMDAVLCKIPGAKRCVPIVRSRRLAFDTDLEESKMIVDWVFTLMYQENKVSKSLERGKFTFTTAALHEIAKKMGYYKLSTIEFGRFISRKINDGDLAYLRGTRVKSKEGNHVHGFIFDPGPIQMRQMLADRRRDEQ